MKKKLLLLYCLSFLSTIAFCQELTIGDTLEIKRQARFCIIQFGDILNQLAKPDEYFRKYNVDNFIRKFYESSSTDQIFRDSVVQIEDDLNPNSSPPTFEEEKTIQRYLNDFFQFYEKSVSTSVVFSDIQISDIRQGEYLYVNVTYENEFLNKHKYIDQPYEKYKRVATIKVEPSNTGWKVLITYIGFFRTPTLEPGEVTFSEDVNKLPSDIKAKEDEALIKDIVEQQPVGLQKGSFSDVEASYKRGESFDVSWNQNFTNPVNLSLYQEKTHKASLNPGITNNEYTGTIPKKTKPGNSYNFQVYDPVTKASLQSGYFTVRRKIPLGLQIPVYVGVGAAIFILLQDKDTTEPFPMPAAPVDN
jgi:hypothetical protein